VIEAGTRLANGEITHSSGKAAVNGDVTFNFSWTAPQTAGTAALYGAGLSSNGSGTGGDEVARMALMVTVAAAPPPNQPPVADPGGPYVGTTGVLIAFDGSHSFDPDGTIASYAWDFGDGTKGSGATPSHSYATTGAFPVTLSVGDTQGATNSATTVANVNGPSVNQPPNAFAGGPYSGLVGRAIAFDGSGSKDPDGSITSYVWDFGDGSAGSGAQATHTYAVAGSYLVTLTVTDDQGASASDTASAVVNDPTTPSLLVWIGAPSRVRVSPDQPRTVEVRVAVDLSSLPAGTTGCGTATLLKGGQVAGSQPVCVPSGAGGERRGAESASRNPKLARAHQSLELKTDRGTIATPRPWRPGKAAKQTFEVPIGTADVPSVVWTAQVDLAGFLGEAPPVRTSVKVGVAGKERQDNEQEDSER
jgi:chitodextrinase